MSHLKKNSTEDFDMNRSEIFNSDYYFDDIIEELSESGLYSDEDIPVETSLNTDQPGDSEKIVTKMDGMKQDINFRIQKIEHKVLSINEMLFNTKNELVQSIQKVQNNLLLMKYETEEGINKVSDLFKEKIANDGVKERAFEELYSQLESYKRSFVDSALKPFFHDMFLLYDRLDSDIEHANSKGIGEPFNLVSFKDELLEILYRNDVIPIEKSLEGEKFNPEKSNGVEKINTDDSSLDNKIKKVLKVGFKKGNLVLRPELVQVYKFNDSQVN